MSGGIFLLVCLAGGLGGLLRYLADTAVRSALARRYPRVNFPWGIAAINVGGSFVLGVLTGALSGAAGGPVLAVLGIGLLGGFTTFSTAMVDSVRLAREGHYRAAVANVVGVLLVAMVCAGAGLWCGRALLGL